MTSSLLQVLTLDPLGAETFRAIHHKENFQQSLFGGQVLGQALMAAGLTVNGLLPHSLHAYFLKAGSSRFPVDYHVSVNRNGRSFSHRTVTAEQNGHVIFTMMASFHVQEVGFEHAIKWLRDYPLPAEQSINAPNELAANPDELKAEAFEFSPLTSSMMSAFAEAPGTQFWMRSREVLPTDALLQACALAYASDFGLLASSLCEHDASIFKGGLMAASIDHSLWFHNHQDFTVSNWLLYEIDSPWAGNARGFSRGRIYNAASKLIASTSQEGLVRPISM